VPAEETQVLDLPAPRDGGTEKPPARIEAERIIGAIRRRRELNGHLATLEEESELERLRDKFGGHHEARRRDPLRRTRPADRRAGAGPPRRARRAQSLLAPATTADSHDLLRGHDPDESTARDEAMEFLEAELAEGPRKSKDVTRAFSGSSRTLDRARKSWRSRPARSQLDPRATGGWAMPDRTFPWEDGLGSLQAQTVPGKNFDFYASLPRLSAARSRSFVAVSRARTMRRCVWTPTHSPRLPGAAAIPSC
jgi:hypothetical protein